jgi:hypothetical protein
MLGTVNDGWTETGEYLAKSDFELRLKILERLAEAARNYHELFEVGDGRNAVANQLASCLHQLDDWEQRHKN